MILSNKLGLSVAMALLLGGAAISAPTRQDAEAAPADKADLSEAKADKAAKKKDENKKDKTLEELVKDMDAHEGIFTLYKNKKSGSLSMAIREDQLNQEFLYFAFVQNGVLEAFHRRGSQLAQDVIEIRKYYDRIEFVKKNTSFIMNPDSPLANGGQANITDAVLATAKIKGTSKDGKRFLISADGLFQTEALARISYNLNPRAKPFEQFSLGKLAKDKVKYGYMGVYPENMNVRTDYVYQNPKPWVSGSDRVADARSTTITVQHSFLTIPDNDFVPRRDDQRVGYFGAQITDLNSFEFMPYRDLISRWHLVKKDPGAALSEPVEPIVWWIENTTPLEYREVMKEGVLAWNSAFETAGFKNAIVVKIQPDDAEWSAEDVRYNVVRWSNTPGAGSAFGPSYINPRTGQIMGGDVMFEHSFVSSYAFRGDVLGNPDAYEETSHAPHDINASTMRCSRGHEMREMVNFGHVAMTAMGLDVSAKRKVIDQMLMELMLHEVGHALGLMHNMKASNLISNDDVHNESITQGMTTGSVMDYTALILAKPGQTQGDYFTTKPGPYDDWAIQFGYDPAIEGDARDALLARSTERELMFGNDADDMRSPGSGIDPRVNVWDMSSDSIGFSEDQFELVNEVTPMLMDKIADDGESWAKLRAATGTMIGYKSRPTATIANFIGGVEVNRSVQGQPGAEQPYVPIDEATQRRAMRILAEHVLAPGAFDLPTELITHSAMQRRGFDHFGGTEDVKLHQNINRVQQVVFSRLLNPTVMLRLTDTQMYGNTYSVDEMMNDLSDAVFEADLKTSVNSRRQNLQNVYVNQLVGIMGSSAHDPRAKAATFMQLKRIENWMDKSRARDGSTKAHRAYLAHLIAKAMDTN